MTSAELTAIVAGVTLLGGVGGWFVRAKTEGPKPMSVPAGETAQSNILTSLVQQGAAMASLTAAVAKMGDHISDVRDAGIMLKARLDTIPNREDLAKAAQDNRHHVNNMIQQVVKAIEDVRDEVRAHYRDHNRGVA